MSKVGVWSNLAKCHGRKITNDRSPMSTLTLLASLVLLVGQVSSWLQDSRGITPNIMTVNLIQIWNQSNAEMFGYSLDIDGDIGEDAWIGDTEPEPEVLNTLNAEPASRANTMIPSEPSRIEDVVKENYPDAGQVISHGMTPFQHIALIPGYKDSKSSHQVCRACYPFKDPEEGEIIDWLLCNHLSKASINDFVKTKYVHDILMTTPELLIHIIQMSA